jgi:uncharacterized lipoprotein YajG
MKKQERFVTQLLPIFAALLFLAGCGAATQSSAPGEKSANETFES